VQIDLIPFALFVSVATFTPGPGNITSAAMGMVFGYRRTFRFLLGIVMGYLSIMMLCAFVSRGVLTTIPSVEPFLRIFGVCYLLWLTAGTARATYAMDNGNRQPLAFLHGFWLQALNPKAIIFGLTIYTTFLASLSTRPEALAGSAFLLALVTFCSVSLWAFVGTRIGSFLHLPGVRKVVNGVLVVLLLYCAFSLSGF
jgi:cysteine/O-acetylserine efflux protein